MHPQDAHFDLYADGAMEADERRAFEAHIRECAPCAEWLDKVLHFSALLTYTVKNMSDSALGPRSAKMRAMRRRAARFMARRTKRHARDAASAARAKQRGT